METCKNPSYPCSSPSPTDRLAASRVIDSYYNGVLPLAELVILKGADWDTVGVLLAIDKANSAADAREILSSKIFQMVV